MMFRVALLRGAFMVQVHATSPNSLLDIDAVESDRSSDRSDDTRAEEVQSFYKFHAVLSKASHARDGAEAAIAVEEAAEMVVKHGVKIDDITKATLQTLKGTLVNTTEGMILQAHQNDQKLLDDHAALVKDCEDSKAKGLEGDDFVLNATNHARQMHRNCQNQLNDMGGDLSVNCQALEDFRLSLRAPLCELPTGEHWRDIMEEFFINLDNWATDTEMQWSTLEQECNIDPNEEARVTTESECHRYQGEFEKHLCTYRLSVINTCYEYNDCFEHSIKDFESTEATVMQNEKSRKVDWRATGKLKCYIDVILSEAVSHERDQMIKDCKHQERETFYLDISYPELPAQAFCDISGIHPYPCSQEFMTQEYIGMLNTECTECTALPPHLQEFADSMASMPASAEQLHVAPDASEVPEEESMSIHIMEGALEGVLAASGGDE